MDKIFIYHVIERDSSGKVVSNLYTKSAMIALSDVLMKSRLNESHNMEKETGRIEKRSYFYQGYSGVPLPQVISGSASTIESLTSKTVSRVEIETMVSDRDISDGYTDSSLDVYRSLTYLKSIAKTSSRLRLFSGGDIDVALVIVALAIREKTNSFWSEKKQRPIAHPALEL